MAADWDVYPIEQTRTVTNATDPLKATVDWAAEREQVQKVFAHMLLAATGDGSVKRQAGLKPPWWRDPDHEAAIYSHLNKWKHGELQDDVSGAHPLVHLAWRALGIAYQETYGKVDPSERGF